MAMGLPLPPRLLPLLLCLCLCTLPIPARSQSQTGNRTAAPASAEGFTCSASSAYPCQAYALYRAGLGNTPPDLAVIGGLFGVSRSTIARANNLCVTDALAAGRPLLVPLRCGCPSGSRTAYAPARFRIGAGDTFWTVSTTTFQNLTRYEAVERANPALNATDVRVGVVVTFPIFCQCPAASDNATALVTYVKRPGDTYASITHDFAVDTESLVSLNGPEQGVDLFSEMLVPLRGQTLPPIILRNNASRGTPASRPPCTTP